MCGRYSLDESIEEILKYYRLEQAASKYRPQPEIFPTNLAPVLGYNGKFGYVKWGFDFPYLKQTLINARGETVDEKKSFKRAFDQWRCLIPATSFFEWNQQGEKKKHRISIPQSPIFSMAGLLHPFRDEAGETYWGYVIVTTEANEQMSAIHYRMPVLLDRESGERYLQADRATETIKSMLHPYTGELAIEVVD